MIHRSDIGSTRQMVIPKTCIVKIQYFTFYITKLLVCWKNQINHHTILAFHFYLGQNTNITSSPRAKALNPLPPPRQMVSFTGIPVSSPEANEAFWPWKQENFPGFILVFISIPRSSYTWWLAILRIWRYCNSEDLKNSLLLLSVCLVKNSSWLGSFFN